MKTVALSNSFHHTSVRVRVSDAAATSQAAWFETEDVVRVAGALGVPVIEPGIRLREHG